MINAPVNGAEFLKLSAKQTRLFCHTTTIAIQSFFKTINIYTVYDPIFSLLMKWNDFLYSLDINNIYFSLLLSLLRVNVAAEHCCSIHNISLTMCLK